MILPRRTGKGGLLVEICTGDGRSYPYTLWDPGNIAFVFP